MKAIRTNAQKVQQSRSCASLSSPLSPATPTTHAFSSPVIETVSKVEHEGLKAQYNSLQSRNSALQEQYGDLRGILQKQLDESLKLSHQNLNLQSELDALRHKIVVQSNDIIQKDTTVQRKEKENVELQKKFSDSELAVQTLKNTATQKNTDLEQQLKENSDLQQKIVNSDREVQNLKDSIAEKDILIEQQKALIEQQEKQSIELHAEIMDLEIEKQNLKDSLVQKDQTLENLLKHHAELQAKVLALKDEQQELTSTLVERDGEVERLNTDLYIRTSTLKESIINLQEELQKSKASKGNIPASQSKSNISEPTTSGQTNDEIHNDYELVGEIVDNC